MNRGISQRLFIMYSESVSLVMMYQPIVATNIVLKRPKNVILKDFCTNCLTKKSDRVAMEINASGGICEIFSKPSPYLLIDMMNMTIAIIRRQ